MSDFLDTLIGRTLARIPVLEPRRPSLFEPVSAPVATNAGRLHATDERYLAAEETPRVSVSAQEAADSPDNHAKTMAPSPPLESVYSAESANTLKPAPWLHGDIETIVADSVRAAMPARPRPINTDLNPDTSGHEARYDTRAADAGADSLSTIVHRHETWQRIEAPVVPGVLARHDDDGLSSRVTNRGGADEPPSPAILPGARASAERERLGRQHLQDPPLPMQESIAVKRARAAPAPPRRAAQQLTKPSSRPPGQPALPPTAAPATIQITIGRVEIRAKPVAAIKPLRPTRQAPNLSLDDYLQSRSEGDR